MHEPVMFYRDSSCMCGEVCEHYLTNKTIVTDIKTKSDESKIAKRKLDDENPETNSPIRTRTKMPKVHDKIRQDKQVDDFKMYLNRLCKCKTFTKLQNEYSEIADDIDEMYVDP
ncbi:hypothetical protein DPMN_175723 [Dreissena polymorpha]|uniref:Uncharacterized protein n=1 Tax=Dreissena polymorpha TaxID=45954 RepID=A0A9D4E7U0_DREPO|nr:hypothetical protein DPMN_175723 [Dreissena polymorpha]